MEFKIEGNYPVLRCFLNKGEEILTSSGNMAWMSDKIDYKVHSGGGFMRAFGRAMTGEGFFQNTYRALEDGQELSFTMSMPGEIIHLNLDGSKSFIAQKAAFLASEPSVEFKNIFTKKISTGLFGGEGFILQKFEGHGNLFLECDGSTVEYNLSENQSLLIDQGSVFLFEESIDYKIEAVKGLNNKLFGGEGFFLVRLTGPGKVLLQTLPISKLAREISSVFPPQA